MLALDYLICHVYKINKTIPLPGGSTKIKRLIKIGRNIISIALTSITLIPSTTRIKIKLTIKLQSKNAITELIKSKGNTISNDILKQLLLLKSH